MNLPADASLDQSNVPADYYRNAGGMLHQLPKSEVATRNLSDDELRKMAKEKLSVLLQGIDPLASPSLLLSVAREVLDRLEGKATQRIEQKIEHSGKMQSAELSNDQLILALRKAEAEGLLPGGVKLLGNGDVVLDAEYVEVAQVVV